MNSTKLHLGCGHRNLGSDWIHIDIADFQHITYKQNVNDLHQFDNESVDLIYASHVLEYFDRYEVESVLKLWYNKLREGGVLRLSVPDFLKLKWVYEDTGDIENILGPLFGRLDTGDGVIYHKTVYTYKSLRNLLATTGFKDIYYWDWREVHPHGYDDHSHAHFPHDPEAIKSGNFTGKHLPISLNIEAIK
jgi:predicted SAM-dependent methyltransferase